MKEEFNLRDKREELLEYFKEQFGEDSLIPNDILRVVQIQDRNFIKRLKERFERAEKNMPIDIPTVIVNYNKMIDKLAGEKLI